MRERLGWVLVAGVAVGALAGVTGCKPDDAVKRGALIGKGTKAAEAAPAAAPLDEATLGSVTGIVKFAGRVPERLKIDMSMDPVCAITGGTNYAEQYEVKDGRLASVYVYIKDGPAAAMSAPVRSTEAVVMDQVGCRYTPHVVAVMRGGTVEFRNSDGTMHNIHTMPTVVGNETIDVSQGAKGAPQMKQFKEPEVMIPVRCNNHPWMNAFINVAPTPFFAVTGADGRFMITGLPAGTYTLAVVHEKMGEQTVKVTVEPKKTVTTDFTYSTK
ncbi:carboxypeptidase regulatory-like domain-containing protein [Edaphobacter bradus]|uniref:carboxypeptidase regulatory-like domain-containing protein n=1 Tax=Edaphobacter bradus TaxID=2259016 RepID=UPI0021DFD14B|nr:carboxypeptidase regulatory-like domain-containing protein [Edaphobacter bradus]